MFIRIVFYVKMEISKRNIHLLCALDNSRTRSAVRKPMGRARDVLLLLVTDLTRRLRTRGVRQTRANAGRSPNIQYGVVVDNAKCGCSAISISCRQNAPGIRDVSTRGAAIVSRLRAVRTFVLSPQANIALCAIMRDDRD